MININRNKALLISLLVVSLGFSGCLTSNDEKTTNEESLYSEIIYTLEVNWDNNSSNYVVNFPLIVNNSKEILKINEDMKVILGNVKYEYKKTIYGNSLEITSNESCIFKLYERYVNLDEITDDSAFLSLESDIGSYEFWLYFNASTNDNLFYKITFNNIAYKDDNIIGESLLVLNGTLKTGWNKYKGEMNSIID